ncbi:MAG: hypothetical protein V3W36_04840, partial [Acidimicrobiia bacterium]
ERAVKHLAVYDVEYYVSFTESATEAAHEFGLDVAAVSEPFTVFRLPAASLVDIASFEPAVWDGDASFVDAAIKWYDDIEGLDRWFVEDGPAAWRRIDNVSLRSRAAIRTSGVVTDIVLEDHRISFSTTAVGVPHLVKVSWFPNWTATGADGPYRAAPSLMIVVPTQQDVVIDFKERLPETAGKVISVATILGLGTMAFIRRRDRKPVASSQ